MLDQWTRLDSCAVLPNLTVKSYHTISSIVITDTTIVKANLSPQIVSGIKINPDAKFYRENDVTLIYQYNDSKSNYLFTITVTPKDYK